MHQSYKFPQTTILHVLFILAIFQMLFLFTIGRAGADECSSGKGPFQFVVFGDTRIDFHDPQKSEPAKYFKKVSEQMKSYIDKQNSDPDKTPVEFIVFLGDFATHGGITENFNPWAALPAMQALIDTHLPIFMAIGNHELYPVDTYGFFEGEHQKQYVEFIDQQGFLPSCATPFSDNYRNLAYSFTWKDASFAFVDTYYIKSDRDKIPHSEKLVVGWIDEDQIGRLHGVINKNRRKFNFVLGHSPVFTKFNEMKKESDGTYVDNTKIGGAANSDLEKFWAAVDANKVDAYITAHEHCYGRKLIDSTLNENWTGKTMQFVTGGGGAKPTDRCSGCITGKDGVCLDSFEKPNRSSGKSYNFVVFNVEDDSYSAKVYNAEGALIDDWKSPSKTGR